MSFKRLIFIDVLVISGLFRGTTPTFRILGGNNVKIEDYPYVVSLQTLIGGKFLHECGGTIISPRFIVSAAHCFRPGNQYAIRAGFINLSSRDGCMVPISMVMYHPSHKFLSQDYDIAVAMLTKNLKLSPKIQPVKLPKYSKEVPLESGTVLGWGGTRTGESSSGTLKAVQIPIIGTEICVGSYPKGLVTERMFCALDEKGQRDSCQGDSGGPLAINGTIYGIVSWGFDCGDPKSPGVYTKVPYFVDFINKSMTQMSFRYHRYRG